MSTIQQLCNDLEKEYGLLLNEVRLERESLAKDRKALNTRKTSLDQREDQIASKEKELNTKEAEIELKWSKVRRDEDIAAQYEESLQLNEKNEKARKELRELIDEKDFRIQEIHKMEAALSAEKVNYKEKIRAEIQEELKKLIK